MITTGRSSAWRYGLLLLCCCGSVLAQQPTELLVTAQKQEQAARDVPFSVDVMDEDEVSLLTASARDTLFLAGRSPSLYAESSSGRTFPRLYIRGLGNTDFDLNANQPVSIVLDDVVLENSVLKGFPVFDIERVEVLRGPQGSLFGRNTPAGVVKFDSVKPAPAASGFLRTDYGRFDTLDVEAAYGDALPWQGWSYRIAGLHQQRDDFVDNIFGGGESGFEEFEDDAARLQLRYTAESGADWLFNVHGRQLDGGSRLFRANIIQPGSNSLVQDFDLFSTGQDARQVLNVENSGASVRVDTPFAGGQLFSITAYESVSITARGDVDGGYGADFAPPVGRGSIPFAAESADNIDDHEQWSHETRYRFIPAESLAVTVGTYLFYEDLSIENLSYDTLADGAVNGLARQEQSTRSAALFASGEWQLAPRWILAAGLRFSDEKKDFRAWREFGPFGAPALSPPDRELEDGVWSGDLSLRHELSDTSTVFARYARGFRTPAAQGRIVFGDVVTVADTETLDSVEIGYKSVWFDGRLNLGLTGYGFRSHDHQLTAVGGAGNFNQLLNADGVRGHGIELDLDYRPDDRLRVSMGYSFNHTEIRDAGLRIAPCAVDCLVLDPLDPASGNALIDGNPLPQSPEHIANLVVDYRVPLAAHGTLFVTADAVYRSKLNFFLYESAEFQSDAHTELGLRGGWGSADGRYTMSLFVRNLHNRRSLQGAVDFNNFTGFVNDPRLWGVSLTLSL